MSNVDIISVDSQFNEVMFTKVSFCVVVVVFMCCSVDECDISLHLPIRRYEKHWIHSLT